MIIGQSLAAGTYPFVWDGGSSVVTFVASNWNSSSCQIEWIDELGTSWQVNGLNQSSNTISSVGNLWPGNFVLNVFGSPVGLDVTIRKVPA